MKDNCEYFSLKAMCAVLEVSRSGYFEWLNRKPSKRQRENANLSAKILEIHTKSRKTYGYRRIHAELEAKEGPCGMNRVARLMKKQDLRPKTVRKFRATTNSNHRFPVFENHLNREFMPTSLDQRWCGDITYIATKEGWLYLATVLDLYSRKIIGWAMNATMTTELVSRALLMALNRRGKTLAPHLLWHSDRGSQYASGEFQNLLKDRGIIGSMSRKGNCWDNAVAESFFGTLKKELVHHEVYETREMAEKSIFEYIEVFYNRQRRHSTLGYLSPAEFEALKTVA